MSWGNEVVLEFLNLYRRESVLWDPKHPQHKNRREIADAWLRIQASININCSVTDLKKKKESLMSSFRLHLSRKKKSPEGYQTSWFAYSLMESFLGGKYECDSTVNQLEHEFFNSTETYNPQAITDHSNRSINTNDRNTLTGRPSRPSPHINPTGNSNNAYYAKSKMDEAVSYLKQAAGEKRETDEYDLYGQLLAKKLRKLDERQRDVAMHEIDNIMFRAKMQSSTSQSRSYSSSPSPVPRKMKSPVFIVTQQTHSQYEDENVQYEEHIQLQPAT